ncbi:surface glycoprotein [Haloferax larsenii]|uniref:Surface glycoprotein n=1 Tax=Haloferax larsenii TaxID=302484 RepID=A0ABY5RDR9_HALLR|nr:BGTF surface domain-containing protein [Haloferax larsenii]UVE50482.1 surface glycoprotein [Haloferax larsenii]
MTRNKQIRAVLLAALMVFSVFAGSIAFSGSAAAAASNVSASVSGDTLTVSGDKASGDTNVTVFVDENGDGDFQASEPHTNNTSAGSGTTFSETIDISSLDEGQSYTAGAIAAGTPTSDGTAADDTDTFSVSDNSAPELDSAVHFVNDTSTNVVELAFSEEIDMSNVDTGDFALHQDDDEQTGAITDVTQKNPGQLLLTTDEVYTGDIEVTIGDDVTDLDGNNVDELDDDNNASVTVATVTVTDDNSVSTTSAYKGEVVALTGGSAAQDVSIESDESQDDNEGFFRDGSTGSNSEVFVFDTSDRNTERYNITIGSTMDEKVQIRDLGLNVTIDDLNVTDEDLIEGDVSARAHQRNIEIRLLDDDGDEVEEVTISATTDGQGDYEFEFNASSEDIDTGDYTVEVFDKASGVTVESDTITVTEAGEGKANFAQSVVTDQRGDVVAIPVTLSNTDQATVTIGTESQGYEANVTVEDGDEDGEVVILWDSSESESTTLADVFDVEDGDDEVLTPNDGDTDVSQPTSDLIDSGDYDLEVRTGTDDAKDADNVGTLVLEDASVDTVAMWTAPDAESFSDLDDVNEALENGNITQDSKIAFGDKAVVQIVAPGLEGSVGAQDDETPNFFSGDYNDSYRLTVNQSNPGPNRDPKIINVSNASVIADGDNDTYFVVFNTEEIEAVRDENDNGVIDNGETTDVDLEDDDAFNVEFKMIADEDVSSSGIGLVDEDTSMTTSFENIEAEHTFDMDPVNVTNADGQTVTGTTDVAPGTELTIRVKSDGDTQPRFLKTATAYVTENNTFSATFDFSEQNVGDTFTVTASGAGDVASDEEVDGNVVESVETTETPEETTETPEETTETPEPTTETPEPTTETPEPTTETTEETTTSTGTPGFGIAVALVALVAAALLAVRRD